MPSEHPQHVGRFCTSLASRMIADSRVHSSAFSFAVNRLIFCFRCCLADFTVNLKTAPSSVTLFEPCWTLFHVSWTVIAKKRCCASESNRSEFKIGTFLKMKNALVHRLCATRGTPCVIPERGNELDEKPHCASQKASQKVALPPTNSCHCANMHGLSPRASSLKCNATLQT